MLINRKFDISCNLDISRNLSTFSSQLHSKASWSFATQSHRHGGALVCLAPPKQSSKPPQIEIWSTIKQWCFFKFQNVKPHRTYVKPPYIKPPQLHKCKAHHRRSGEGSVATPSFSLAISLVTAITIACCLIFWWKCSLRYNFHKIINTANTSISKNHHLL